jgi:hypothetical protein
MMQMVNAPDKIDLPRVLEAHRTLATSYAAILRLADSPRTQRQYQRPITPLGKLTAYDYLSLSIFGFLLIALILVWIYKPSWPIDVYAILLTLFVISIIFLWFTELVGRYLLPIFVRTVSLDFVIRILVHAHIKRRLLIIIRRYRALLSCNLSGNREDQEMKAAAEAFSNLAKELKGFDSILYLSLPPFVAALLPKFNLYNVIAITPVILLLFSGFYILYVWGICFSRKRELFLIRIYWEESDTEYSVTSIYKEENDIFSRLDIDKPREFQVDLALFTGLGLIGVFYTVYGMVFDPTEEGGITFNFILSFCFYAYILCFNLYKWRRRVKDGLV